MYLPNPRASGGLGHTLTHSTHTERRSSGMYPLVPLLHASCPAVSSFGKLCGKTVVGLFFCLILCRCGVERAKTEVDLENKMK